MATGDIVIQDLLSVGGQTNGILGPGGGLTSFCTGSTGAGGTMQPDPQAELAGSGGGGGGFGGTGGTGAEVTGVGNQASAGGNAVGVSELVPLRGGCSGGAGGGGAGNAGGGRGGAAGGAVQLVSATAVRVEKPSDPVVGVISARGAGGVGGATNPDMTAGGGGGGSGGAILIEAPEIVITGALIANGGGGGGGPGRIRLDPMGGTLDVASGIISPPATTAPAPIAIAPGR